MKNMNQDRPMKVLLVEDDEDSAAAMVTIMVKRGMDVVRVRDGATALRELNPAVHDAVVTDIRLPEMSGVELLEHIRKTEPELPVLFVTAYDSMETAIKAVRLGAQDYILKPLDDIDDLLVPLNNAIRNHRALLQNRAFEEERKNILENSVDIMFMLDLHGHTVEYLSRSVETLLGRSPAECVAADISVFIEIIHPDDRQGVLDLLQAASAHGVESGLKGIECRMRHRNGDYRWFSWRHSVIFDSKGAAIALVGNARDITESIIARNREREAQVRHARDERMGSLAILAGGIAHDLNNMLGPVRAASDFVETYLSKAPQGDYAEQIRGCMRESREHVDRIIRTVKELLLLSKAEAQKLESLDLNRVICSCLDGARLSDLKTRHGNVVIETSLCSGMPPIKGSELHLQRVVMNLVINACQAMPNGGQLMITTSTEHVGKDMFGYQVVRAGDYVVARFRDSGIGIPMADFDRIFEPFFSTKEKTADGGSGLGLAIVHGIMKYHKGLIDVRSEPGKGTEFIMYFPFSHCSERKFDEYPIPAMKMDGKERILVVDDAGYELELAEKILTRLGYSVMTARTGRDAIRLFQNVSGRDGKGRSPVDLVMLDMALEEDFDGLDTYREVTKIQPGQKCIIVSAFEENERTQEAIRLGVGRFLKKPYTLEGLGRTIRAELDRR